MGPGPGWECVATRMKGVSQGSVSSSIIERWKFGISVLVEGSGISLAVAKLNVKVVVSE